MEKERNISIIIKTKNQKKHCVFQMAKSKVGSERKCTIICTLEKEQQVVGCGNSIVSCVILNFSVCPSITILLRLRIFASKCSDGCMLNQLQAKKKCCWPYVQVKADAKKLDTIATAPTNNLIPISKIGARGGSATYTLLVLFLDLGMRNLVH